MSLPGKRPFSYNEQTSPSTTSDPIRPVHTPAAAGSFVLARRDLLRRRGGAPPRISPLTLVHTPHQSHNSNGPVTSSPLHLVLPFFLPAAVSPQKFSFSLLFSLSTALIKLLPLSPLSCVETKTKFFLHCKTNKYALKKALTEHDIEARSAQKKIK